MGEPSVTTDTVAYNGDKILLIRRGNYPYKTYGHNFDPRMKIVDVAFSVRVSKKDMDKVKGLDDACDARWFQIENVWFDKMEKLKDYFIRQGNEVVKIKAEIKAEGKQFKDIIKTTTDSKVKKQARQDYEDMIKRKLLRITKKEQILAIGMKED